MTQDMPTIVQAILDAVTSQSTTAEVPGTNKVIPSPVPGPVQVGTNDPMQVATIKVIPSSATTEVVPSPVLNKLPAVT